MNEFFPFVIIIAGLIGWILNIFELGHANVIGGMVILRAVGIFVAPLGAVLGYL